MYQCFNKFNSDFTIDDEKRLFSMAIQVAMAIDNAKLFEETINLKNYAESVFHSLSNGVITLDNTYNIQTINRSASKIIRHDSKELVGKNLTNIFINDQKWIIESINKSKDSGSLNVIMDTSIKITNKPTSINFTTAPLISNQKENIGSLIVLDDITEEKDY